MKDYFKQLVIMALLRQVGNGFYFGATKDLRNGWN